MKRFAVSTLAAACGILLATTAHASYFEKGFVEDPEWKTQDEVEAETEARIDARTTGEKEEELRFNPVEKKDEDDDVKPNAANDDAGARAKLDTSMSELTLSANADITRAQFTALLVRSQYSQAAIDWCYWDITSVWPPKFELLFRDVPVDHPYAPEICVAMRDGLVRGYGNDVFRPDAHISFADAAKMLARSHGLTPWADPSTPKHWFDPYVIALGRRNAIPVWIDSIDQRMKVSDAQEMMQRLATGNTGLPSRSADEMIADWERKNAPRPAPVVRRPSVPSSPTPAKPSSPSSAPAVSTGAKSSAAAVSSVKPQASSAPAGEQTSSRPKAWYEF